MLPISSTESAPLIFDLERNEFSKKTIAPTNKIGWLHFQTDKPGSAFDLIIKDALGRTMFKRDFKSEVDVGGALINLPVKIGEELEVVLENVKGAKKVNFFLN